MKPPWSLSGLSLVVRPTVAPPCLNKGNLLLLRWSFLFCLAGTMPYSCHALLQGIFLGDLPNPGIKPCLLCFLNWQAGSLPPEPPGKPKGGSMLSLFPSSYPLEATVDSLVCTLTKILAGQYIKFFTHVKRIFQKLFMNLSIFWTYPYF